MRLCHFTHDIKTPQHAEDTLKYVFWSLSSEFGLLYLRFITQINGFWNVFGHHSIRDQRLHLSHSNGC